MGKKLRVAKAFEKMYAAGPALKIPVMCERLNVLEVEVADVDAGGVAQVEMVNATYILCHEAVWIPRFQNVHLGLF